MIYYAIGISKYSLDGIICHGIHVLLLMLIMLNVMLLLALLASFRKHFLEVIVQAISVSWYLRKYCKSVGV